MITSYKVLALDEAEATGPTNPIFTLISTVPVY